MKIYRGSRTPGGAGVVTREDGSLLPLRLDLHHYCPPDFEWGYLGSGPAQLALALLADCLQDDARALDLHQDFKAYFVARLPEIEAWTLPEDYVRKIAGELARAQLRVVASEDA